ncbi:MAG: hypothetical protein LBF61_12500 [Azoarcus sp.]|jgi:hypothetical protein|nr:hypothetical protein [Azoarcus sp.]
MALDSYRYRDPLEVLMLDEARTCRGCSHQTHGWAFGVAIVACTKPDEKGNRRQSGRRCKDYKEAE